MDGFALLGSHLGSPDRKILSAPQIRNLTAAMAGAGLLREDRSLQQQDLLALGCGPQLSCRILELLSQQEQLKAYLREGERLGCHLLTRGEKAYPLLLRRRLGGESPCCLFYKGDHKLLQRPAVALVGSRDLHPSNRAFAREAGRQAALHGLTLVSGNARGADRTAQEACLEAGGTVISVVADELCTKTEHPRILYLSLEDFDAPFSSPRALSRNRVIHSLGLMTLVAQCSLETGGTWSGTTQNLRHGWSLVACFRDGSPASLELEARGAYLLETEDLSRLTEIEDPQLNLFEDPLKP